MTNKKSVINEAKADFEEIKQFAKEEALKQLQKKFQPKLDEMVNKSLEEAAISIETGGASINIDDNSINVDKDGNTVSVELNTETSALEAPIDNSNIEIPSTEDVESIDNEINEEDILFEIKLNEEDGAPAPVSNPFQQIFDKLDSIEKKLEGGTTDDASAEGEVAIVDDDNIEAAAPVAPEAAPTPAPVAPVPQQTQQIKEEEYMDNNDDEIMKEIMNHLAEELGNTEETDDDSEEIELESDEDDDTVEFEISNGETAVCACDDNTDSNDTVEFEDETLKDDLKEFEFDDDFSPEDIEGLQVKKMSDDGGFEDYNEEDDDVAIIDNETEESGDEDEIEEMLGVSHSVSSKGQSSKFDTGRGESSRINANENKAQNESKLDELKEENSSLRRDIKEYEDSFVELRTSIDEMQTFNAKLALANKLFLNGGLSTEEKISINESLDKASSVKEAEKIYQKIVKDNNILIKESKSNKIKSSTVNVAPSSKQPLYEGAEAKVLKEETERRQILAGILKSEE